MPVYFQKEIFLKNYIKRFSIVAHKPDQCQDEIEDIFELQTHYWDAEFTERLRLASPKWLFM